MVTLQLSNNLGLAPPKTQPSIQPIDPSLIDQVNADQPAEQSVDPSTDVQTQFVFELPTGYLGADGQLHRQGIMRLARTVDEIEPMADPRVQLNPAYATVIILARVFLSLGTLPEVSPIVVEGLFAGDLNYLQNFYRKINNLME